ncbi:MAG: thiamine diphosphokinase [Bacillota bacterium]
MQSRCLVIAGGEIKDYSWHRGFISPQDFIICADGGANHAFKMGLTPNLVVGDLDSIDPLVERELRAAGCSFLVYPREKDQTDLQLALAEAVKRFPRKVIVLGGLGARLDHTLANIALLLPMAERGIDIKLVDQTQEIGVLYGPAQVKVEGEVGDLVSLLPLSKTVTGVTLVGFYYPLFQTTLVAGDTLGISNQITADQAQVNLQSGALLVIKTKPGT